MIKTLSTIGVQGNILSVIRNISSSMQPVILNSEKLNAFYPRSGTTQGCPLPAVLLGITLEVLATAIVKKKK